MKRLSEDSEDEEDPVKEFVRSVRFDIESEAHKNSNSPAAGRDRLSINRSVSMSLMHAKSVSRREEVCRKIRQSHIFSKNGFKLSVKFRLNPYPPWLPEQDSNLRPTD